MDSLDAFLQARPPTAGRPLLGLTVLLVEDSRYASEAFRLLCLRSGARIRRADTLAAATKHLRVYRPTVVIVDLGLPDGSGANLIEELSRSTPRVEVLLGTSGDLDAEAVAIAAGADGFLTKPMMGLAEFQSAILQHLPSERHPNGPRTVTKDRINPDPIALRDDLVHAAEALSRNGGVAQFGYVIQFLAGVARTSGDTDLAQQLDALVEGQAGMDAPESAVVAELAALVELRLQQGQRI